MHYFSGKGCFEFLESMHYCIGILSLTYITAALEKCQREDGFLFASQEEIFDRVENKKPAWVPWYTMHKILS